MLRLVLFRGLRVRGNVRVCSCVQRVRVPIDIDAASETTGILLQGHALSLRLNSGILTCEEFGKSFGMSSGVLINISI